MFACLGPEGGAQGLGHAVQEVYIKLHRQHLLNTSFARVKHPKTCLLFWGGGVGFRKSANWLCCHEVLNFVISVWWLLAEKPTRGRKPFTGLTLWKVFHRQRQRCVLCSGTQRSYLVSLPTRGSEVGVNSQTAKDPFPPWPPGVSPQQRFLFAIQLKTKTDFQLNL